MDALAGIWLVLRTPRLWPMCLGPLAAALLVYVGVGVIGGVLLVQRLPGWLGIAPGGRWYWLVETLGGVAFTVLWIFLLSYAWVFLAGIFSGLIFDRLSLAVENLAGGAPPDAKLGCGTLAGDSLARLALNGTLGVAGLIASLLLGLGPIPAVLVAALVGLLDYTSPAYLRRGRTLGPQAGRLLGKADGRALAFAVIAGLVSLMPLVGVLAMPGLVAGGTLLTRRREGGPPSAPAA